MFTEGQIVRWLHLKPDVGESRRIPNYPTDLVDNGSLAEVVRDDGSLAVDIRSMAGASKGEVRRIDRRHLKAQS